MLIAQITDLHIIEKDKHWLSEPLTKIQQRLSRVISTINALHPAPDVLLITGDLTDDGLEASYCHARELLDSLEIPFYVIPGNHDCRSAMRIAFSKQPYIPAEGFLQYVVDDYPVRFIGLDTLVEGKAFGSLCEEQIDWLEKTLNDKQEKPTLLFMHHPPIKIGVGLFDQINCRTPSTFEHLIREQENLLGILAGHCHHCYVSSFGGKFCFLAPSVAPVHYISDQQDDFVSAVELEDPGITLHQWQGGNVIISHVIRVKEEFQRIDWVSINR